MAARGPDRAHHRGININVLIDTLIYEPRLFWSAALVVGALAWWREHYAHLHRRTTFTPHHAPAHPIDPNGTWTMLGLVVATLAYGAWVALL